MRLLSLLAILINFISAEIYPIDIRPEGYKKDIVGSIKILDQKELIYPDISGINLSEISDLAYSSKNHWLFMLSDRGKLFRFYANFGEKKEDLKPIDAYKLKSKSGKRLKKRYRDSEGLAIDDKDRLYVSFEGKPRVALIDYKGRILNYFKLPSKINKAKKFRSTNLSLEALAWHKKFGLVVASEKPVKSSKRGIQTIYSLSGREWNFKENSIKGSAITAIEVLDNGNFLVLERAFRGIFKPLIISLREVSSTKRDKNGLYKSRLLAKFDNSKGWGIDNFEGLAKVGKNRFVMVSDDNDNFFQKTLLIYFEVIEKKE